MAKDIRPSKPNYGSGYDQKRGDQFGERDGHGGYVSDKKPPEKDNSYNHAHGAGRQLESTNPKAGKKNLEQ